MTEVNNGITNFNTCTTGEKKDKYKLYLQVTENSYDITTNTSNVSYTGWIQGVNTVTTFYGYPMSGSIKNGQTVLASGSATATRTKPVSSANAYVLASGNSNFTHNSDGTLTISLVFDYTSTSPHASAGSVTTTLVLSRIPRASTIVAIDCNIESGTNITINKADPSFTTSITYNFAGTSSSALAGTIVTRTSENVVGWTVPASFYDKIPDSKTGVCTLIATTYNGDTNIGTSMSTFTVTANEALCAPTGSLSVVDSNSTTTNLTGDNNKIVLGQSNANCTITKSALNGASITSVKINDEEIGTSASSYTINKTNTNIFILSITDSRGYTTIKTVTKPFVNYFNITAKCDFVRNTSTDGKVNLKYDGNYFNSSFGTTNNSLTVKYRYKESEGNWSSWTNLSPTKSGNTYSQEVQLAPDFIYTEGFDFELQASDRLTNVTISDSITKGIPVYWWNKNSFNMEVDGYIKGSKIPTIDLIYPIGSIYLTVNNVNPTTLFGGSWEQIRDRFLLSAGSTYSAGSIGGNATHNHTLENAFAKITYDWINNENRVLFQGRAQNFTASRYTTTQGPSFTDGSMNVGTATNLGGSTDNASNMPPYIAVYVWKRVA